MDLESAVVVYAVFKCKKSIGISENSKRDGKVKILYPTDDFNHGSCGPRFTFDKESFKFEKNDGGTKYHMGQTKS